MSVLRRFIKLLAAAALIVLYTLLHKLNTDEPSQGRWRASGHEQVFLDSSAWSSNGPISSSSGIGDSVDSTTHVLSAHFRHGMPKVPGSIYSRVMVVPRLEDDDVSWIANELPGIDTAIYVANNHTAPLHPPRNRGHEVMAYLTYIIDHYYNLPDVVVFMHAHRWTHHNIELLGHDSAEMVRRLNDEYVIHEGYVNMRCQWYPGCPEWLHPGEALETLAKQEQVALTKAWQELFPSTSLPEALGQPCCAQFALSKTRLLSIPLSRFVFYRDWVLKTPLNDYVSGRIWEYLWQFLFTGKSKHCPSEEICNCRGFGVCFESIAGYKSYKGLHYTKEKLELELENLRRRQDEAKDLDMEDKIRNVGSPYTVMNQNRRYALLNYRVVALEKEIRVRQIEASKGSISSNSNYRK